MKLSADLSSDNGEWLLNMKAVYAEQQEDGSPTTKQTVEKTVSYLDLSHNGKIEIQFGI